MDEVTFYFKMDERGQENTTSRASQTYESGNEGDLARMKARSQKTELQGKSMRLTVSMLMLRSG